MPEATLRALRAVSNRAYGVSEVCDSENALNTLSLFIHSTKAVHWTFASANYTIK